MCGLRPAIGPESRAASGTSANKCVDIGGTDDPEHLAPVGGGEGEVAHLSVLDDAEADRNQILPSMNAERIGRKTGRVHPTRYDDLMTEVAGQLASDRYILSDPKEL